MIPTKEEFKKYVDCLNFKNSTEHEKTLVIGNLNTFYDKILKDNITWERTGEVIGRDPMLIETVNGYDIDGVWYEGLATISCDEIIKVEDIELYTE